MDLLRTRHRALTVAATVGAGAATAGAVGVALVDSSSGGVSQLMLGCLSSAQITGLATIVALAAISYMLFAIKAPPGWLVPVIIGRTLSLAAALLAAFCGVIFLPSSVTPLSIDGCQSGYVVEERSLLFSSSITVFERDGVIVTPVLDTGTDDPHEPFAAGEYRAWVTDGQIEGWFARERGSNTALGRFELPIRPGSGCQAMRSR